MSYFIIEDKELAKIQRVNHVYRYVCSNCGEEVDCNSHEDKKPDAKFCKHCGAALDVGLIENEDGSVAKVEQ